MNMRGRRLMLMMLGAGVVTLAVAIAYLARGPASVPPNGVTTVLVNGMHCDGCAGGLASELRRLPGVERVEVSLTNGTAVVWYDTNRVGTRQLLEAIKEAGFEGRSR